MGYGSSVNNKYFCAKKLKIICGYYQLHNTFRFFLFVLYLEAFFASFRFALYIVTDNVYNMAIHKSHLYTF